MPSFIRNPKDFWSGIIFVAVALATVLIARDYSMGTAGRMGPAYFPTVLGGLLGLIGVIAILRSIFGSVGEAITGFAIKPLILVLLSALLFGFLFRQAGLIFAIFVLVFVSSYASIKFKFLHTLMLASGLSLFSWLVFVKLLNLPLPVFGPWFIN